MGLLADVFRAVADGLDQAAGRDPVDRHADEARAVLDEPEVPCGNRDGKLGYACGKSLGHDGNHRVTVAGGSIVWPNPDLIAADEQAAIDRERRDDPDVVELVGPIPDHETGLELGLVKQELRRYERKYESLSRNYDVLVEVSNAELTRSAEYQREIERLNEQLAEKPYRIDTGERVLHVRPGEGVLVEVAPTVDVDRAVQMRERFEERFPDVRIALVKGAKQIQIITAAEQTVVDAARAYAKLFGPDWRDYIVVPEGRAVAEAIEALDTAEADA